MPNVADTIEVGGTDSPRRRRHALAVVRVGLFVVCWLDVAVLGLVALLRLVAWDSFEPLIVLDALAVTIYLPDWVVAVGALIVRRWRLAAAAVSLLSSTLRSSCQSASLRLLCLAWARHAPAVRVFDANIDRSFHFEARATREPSSRLAPTS